MVQPVILEKLEKLSDSLQTEVLHYIEFLSERYTKTDEDTIAPRTKRGGLGSLKGKIWMADDFDAPLEDLQEYM
ncbi:MAG: DUF2281 domain-containing protein [Alkalinema sp. CAN_BIN05]|nr:DUF2281 domain-containing protein [Alkalinema sp. CAN_BIN05]